MKYLLLLTSLFISLHTEGQQIDSVRSKNNSYSDKSLIDQFVASTHKNPDSVRTRYNADQLLNHGVLYTENGRYKETIDYLKKGNNSSIKQKVEQKIASIDSLWNKDKYDEAITLIHSTIPYIIRVYGKNSKDYYQFLNMSSQIYRDSGNYKQAMSMIDEVIKGLLHLDLSNDELYAKALSNKGLYCIDLGEAAKAIPIFGEAIQIFKANPPSLNYATCLKDLAIAYYDTGQYDKALTAGTMSKNMLPLIKCSILDAEYVCIEIGYNDLISEFGDAKASIIESYRIIDKLKQANLHIGLQSHLLLALACTYLSIKDYNKALDTCSQAIQFTTTEHNLDREDLGTIYLYQGMAYYFLQKYESARDSFLMSLKFREQTSGLAHHYTIESLRWLVDAYDCIGDAVNIAKYTKTLSERINSDFLDQFPKLDSKAQVEYWGQLYSEFYLNTLPNLCQKFNEPLISELTFNGVLLGKGILLESDIRFKHALQSHYDQSYSNRYNSIEQWRNVANANMDSLDYEEQKLRLEFINNSNYLDIFKISWEDVASNLNSKEVAIEFVASTIPATKNKQYAALIVTEDCNSPKYIKLFTSEDLSNISQRKYYITNLLSKLLWEPLINEFNGKSIIYFSPIGELFNIAIENLPYPTKAVSSYSTTFYMSDKFTMVRLNSTRELTDRGIRNFVTSAALFGDMNYDGNLLSVDSLANRPSQNRGNDYRSGFGSLPGTKIEIANIYKTLSIIGIDITTYAQESGTKDSFIRLSGHSPSIIHIATHGFYNEENIMKNSLSVSPLDRAGLVFTGFNQHISSRNETNAGCVTATEISQMNLYDTDIAVLSACQSGLGEVDSDGVYGLQRGFKMAGVSSLMMSLWNVDDDATQMLMTEFYKNYASGLSKLESLKIAQNKVRNFRGEINGVRRNFSKPRYWAAFILLDALN